MKGAARYRREMIEMHISEIGFCSGHSASGVFVDEFARTTVPGLYAAGDMANVPHNYMLGAFTNGAIAGEDAIDFAGETDFAEIDKDFIEARRNVYSLRRATMTAFPPTRSNTRPGG